VGWPFAALRRVNFGRFELVDSIPGRAGTMKAGRVGIDTPLSESVQLGLSAAQQPIFSIGHGALVFN
jgi:hypothetical protein